MQDDFDIKKLSQIFARAIGTAQGSLKELREREDELEAQRQRWEHLQQTLINELNLRSGSQNSHKERCSKLYQEIVQTQTRMDNLIRKKIELSQLLYGNIADECDDFDEQLGEDWKEKEFMVKDSKFLQEVLKNEKYTDALFKASQLELENYCICTNSSTKAGPMIQCEGKGCSKRWYHLDCLGMSAKKVPRGQWMCQRCTARGSQMRPEKKGGSKLSQSGRKK